MIWVYYYVKVEFEGENSQGVRLESEARSLGGVI